jgi:hypothetical protein
VTPGSGGQGGRLHEVKNNLSGKAKVTHLQTNLRRKNRPRLLALAHNPPQKARENRAPPAETPLHSPTGSRLPAGSPS